MTKLLIDLTFIFGLLGNYFGLYKPFTETICKCIPVYFIFGMVLAVLAMILIYLCYVLEKKPKDNEEFKKIFQKWKPADKKIKYIMTAIFIFLFALNGFTGNIILYLCSDILDVFYEAEIEGIKESIGYDG